MTSEVLMLNKDAVVIAADSAVTTGRDPHPRYSKSANKIFDLSVHGNVAVTIYAGADIDRVPWELALKLFRKADANNPERSRLEDYKTALLGFLQVNNNLFPAAVRGDILKKRLYRAAGHVLSLINATHPEFQDVTVAAPQRQAVWQLGHQALAAKLAAKPLADRLQAADVAAVKAAASQILPDISKEILADPVNQYVDPAQLTDLSVEALTKEPINFLSSTGVVIAGYGSDEIFPTYTHLRVYGHIGDTLFWNDVHSYKITHDNDAWIQPFAQSSMIERFTDGFDSTLAAINHQASLELVQNVLADIAATGVALVPVAHQQIVATRQREFMDTFRLKNWDENFYPLRRVLNSLSVSEMGHLAESLLVLEALRERVTSPSESVGGPIDVAVITKGEGLIWLKRKHYFDPQLNVRYMNRVKH